MIITGDCLEELKKLEENSVDSVVTDPPYELGFMGKSWDNTGIANNVEMWAECLRVLKPGGHLLSFSGTRTYHRMAVAIEDAGFEIRDMIEWVYGSGFPKSLNIGKAVDKLQGNERDITGLVDSKTSDNKENNTFNASPRFYESTKGTSEWEGWGTALKPAHEPICMARKPLSEKSVAENCLKWGTGGINIDESRVEAEPELAKNWDRKTVSDIRGGNFKTSKAGAMENRWSAPTGRFPANLIHDNSEEVRECFPENVKGEIGRAGRKSGGDYEASSYKVGVVTETGFKDNGNASRFFKSIIYTAKASKSERNKGCEGLEEKQMNITETNARTWNDRCKTCGKKFVGSDDTICHCPPELKITDKTVYTQKNNHPTVKPIALMEYLIKMVTPKGGTVLDPFTGSGSTGIAAKLEGFNFIGIEKEEEYVKIAEARIEAWEQNPQGSLL